MTLIARAPVISSRNQRNAPTPTRYDSDRVVFEGQVFEAPELDKYACVKQGPAEEFALFVDTPGDLLQDSPSFRWTRNDSYQTRMKWDESKQSWVLLPGSSPILAGVVRPSEVLVLSPAPSFPLGSTLPGTNDPTIYAMLRVGVVPDEDAYPLGKGVQYKGVLVIPDEDVDTYEFPESSSPSGVIGENSGRLILNPNLSQQWVGMNLWYSPAQLFSGGSDLAPLLDFNDHPVFLSPIPSPEEYPCLTFGSRLPVSVRRFATETDLFAASLAEGEVGYAASTGRLRVSLADMEKADPTNDNFQRLWFDTKLQYGGLFVGSSSPVRAPAEIFNGVLPQVPNVDALLVSGWQYDFDGTGAVPKTVPTPTFTPNGSGLVISVPKGVFYNANHTVYDFRIGNSGDPTVPGEALIYYSLDENQVQVEFDDQDLVDFGSATVLFRQFTYLPSHDFTSGIVSRKRWQFDIQKGDTLTVSVNGSRYRWTASTTAILSDVEAAASLRSVLPDTVTVSVSNGHLVLQSSVAISVAYGYYVGSILVRDFSGCKSLGFLPGWSNTASQEDHGYGVALDIESGTTLAQTAAITGVVSTSIVDTYYTFLQHTPLLDYPGFTSEVFFRVESGNSHTNLIPYKNSLYLFSEGKLAFADQTQVEMFAQTPMSSFALGKTLVVPNTTTPPIGYLEVSEGNGYAPADAAYFPQQGSSGSLVLTREIYPTRVRGEQGVITAVAPHLFVDIAENFDDVPTGSLLIIRSGGAEGVYPISQANGNVLNLRAPFSVDVNLQGVPYEIAFATEKGLVADAQYQSFSVFAEEPFSIFTVTSLGVNKPSYLVPAGITPAFYEGDTALETVALAFLSLGVLSEFVTIPLPFDWTLTPYRVQVGDTLYIPTSVMEFSDMPNGVQCRVTDGVLKFGSQILALYAGDAVYLREAFPAVLEENTAYVDVASGAVVTSATGEIFWRQPLVVGADVQVNPANGSFLLSAPLSKGQRLLVHYWKDDAGEKGEEITEYLPFFVIGETAVSVSTTQYTFNPTNRAISSSVPLSVSVGGALQNYGGVETYRQVGNTLVFAKPVDPSLSVTVTYGVLDAAGGEQSGTVSSPPVWRPPFNLAAGQNTFSVEGVQDFEVGGLLRLGSSIKTIDAVSAGENTSVVFSPASPTEIGSRSPGVDVNTLRTGLLPDDFWVTVSNRIRPAADKSPDLVIEGNVDVISGVLMEVDGNPYVVVSVEKDPEGFWTKVTLGESLLAASAVPLVRVSRRPVYPENATAFLCPEALIPELGIEVILVGEKGRVLEPSEYALGISGTVQLAQPLRYGESLYVRGTQARVLAPTKEFGVLSVPKMRAQFTNLANPSTLGFTGKTLTANYQTYQPDQFGYQLSEYESLKPLVENEITVSGDAQGVGNGYVRPWGTATEYSRAEALSEKDAIAARMLADVQPVLEAAAAVSSLEGKIFLRTPLITPDSDVPAVGHFHPLRQQRVPHRVSEYWETANIVDDLVDEDAVPAYRHPNSILFPSFVPLMAVVNGVNEYQTRLAKLSFPDDRFESPVITNTLSVFDSTRVYDVSYSTTLDGETNILVHTLPNDQSYRLAIYNPQTNQFDPVQNLRRVITQVVDGEVSLGRPTALFRGGDFYDGQTGDQLNPEEIGHPLPMQEWTKAILVSAKDDFDTTTQEGLRQALASNGIYRPGIDLLVEENGEVFSLKSPDTLFPFDRYVPTVQPAIGSEIEAGVYISYRNASPIWENVSGKTGDVVGNKNMYPDDRLKFTDLAIGGTRDLSVDKTLERVLTVYDTYAPGQLPGVFYGDTSGISEGSIVIIGAAQAGLNGLKGFHTVASVTTDYLTFARLPVHVEEVARMNYRIDNAAVFDSYADGITVTVTTGPTVETTISQPSWGFGAFDSLLSDAEDGFFFVLEILRRDTDPGVNPEGSVQETLTFTKVGGSFEVTSSIATSEPVLSLVLTGSSMQLDTASPVVDLSLFDSTAGGITGTRLAAISLDSSVGSVEGGPILGGTIVHPGFDCLKMRPRGFSLSVNPAIIRETQIDLLGVAVDAGVVDSCSAARVNNGVPFTLPYRGSDVAGDASSFTLASIEGYGNTPLSGTYKAVVCAPTTEFTTVGYLGSSIHDPLIFRPTVVDDDDFQLTIGMTLSVTGVNTSKAGTYYARYDARNYVYAPRQCILEEGREFSFIFPKVESVSSVRLIADRDLSDFPESGFAYFIMRESDILSEDPAVYAGSVIRVTYAGRSGKELSGFSGPVWADGSTMTLATFREKIVQSTYMSGEVTLALNFGNVAGDATVGSLGLTDVQITNALTGLSEFAEISDPATVVPKPLPAYKNTPGGLQTGLSDIPTTLLNVHNPNSIPGANIACVLRSDLFTAVNPVGDPGFTGVQGIYLLQNEPKHALDLNSSLYHVVSERYTGVETGLWNPELEEEVEVSVSNIPLWYTTEDANDVLDFFRLRSIPVYSYAAGSNVIYTLETSLPFAPFSVIRAGGERRYVAKIEGSAIHFFGNPLREIPSEVLVSSLEYPPVSEALRQCVESLFDTVWYSERDFATQEGAYVDVVNVLRDSRVTDFRTLDIQVGDFILVDREGALQGPNGMAHPVQYGRPSTREVFIGDDNRGYYQVSEVLEDRLVVSCESFLLKGDRFTEDKTYQGKYFYPHILTEGQGDLRVTAYAVDREFLTSDSIAPFSYRVLRPKSGVSAKEAEFVLAIHDQIQTYQGEVEVFARIPKTPEAFAAANAVDDPSNTTLTFDIYNRLFPSVLNLVSIVYEKPHHLVDRLVRLMSEVVREGAYYERRYALLDYRVNRETGTKTLSEALSSRVRGNRKKRRARGLFRRG